MRSFHAIFENGHLDFQFHYPEHLGPTKVIVIFPDIWDDPKEEELDDWDPSWEDIPN